MKDGPRRLQDGLKIAPKKASAEPQKGPKMALRGPEMALRRAEDGPRCLQQLHQFCPRSPQDER